MTLVSYPDGRSFRALVDSDLSSFYQGKQFRTFKEFTLAAGATLVIRMIRPVNLVLRSFHMQTNDGELRCEVYRDATLSGTWTAGPAVIPKCEFLGSPAPYTSQCSFSSGGSATGGVLYDVMHLRTSAATSHSSTVAAERNSQLGIPAGSVGTYKFINPGNASVTGLWAMWWEEFPDPT